MIDLCQIVSLGWVGDLQEGEQKTLYALSPRRERASFEGTKLAKYVPVAIRKGFPGPLNVSRNWRSKRRGKSAL